MLSNVLSGDYGLWVLLADGTKEDARKNLCTPNPENAGHFREGSFLPIVSLPDLPHLKCMVSGGARAMENP
jgi:hypothetical protein